MAKRNFKTAMKAKSCKAPVRQKDLRTTDREVIFPAPVTIFDQIDAESKRYADFAESIRGVYEALIHAPDGCTYDLVDLSVLHQLREAFRF